MNPYHALNLHRNPFGELTRDEWIDVAVTDLQPVVEQLHQPKVAIQLRADHGRGKTTHLLKIASEIPTSVYFRAGRDPAPTSGTVLIMDEAQCLWMWQRMQIARRFQSIAYSTHRDLSHEFRLLGFRVVPLEVNNRTVERLDAIIRQRIARAHRGDGAPLTIESSHLEELHRQFNDDIRGIVEELYHHVQTLARTHV